MALKALVKLRWTISLSTTVITSQKAIRLARWHFSFINSCWLHPGRFLFFTCLEMLSRITCSITFQSTGPLRNRPHISSSFCFAANVLVEAFFWCPSHSPPYSAPGGLWHSLPHPCVFGQCLQGQVTCPCFYLWPASFLYTLNTLKCCTSLYLNEW